jgi:UDP-GlcNAc3NAcA epimerase
MKIITIIGARPQFIKASVFSREVRSYNLSNADKIKEIIIHTGQHFDANMSEIFFQEMEIPEPDYNLSISCNDHGSMTGNMLIEIEKVLKKEKPDFALVYGDTNSTLAGSIAAVKLHIPIVHVESGLRSFNNNMPEEINRVLTDRVSTLLMCPSVNSVKNLELEGIIKGVHHVGDIMYDAALFYQKKAKKEIDINHWNVKEREYIICTIHRAENTDNIDNLKSILEALRDISKHICVILPIHPRVRIILKSIKKNKWLEGIMVVEPLSYLEITRLLMSAKVVMTDSGGVQKEAFFHKVPCITMRDETEWLETVELGWNVLSGSNKNKILSAYRDSDKRSTLSGNPYGDGHSSTKILNHIISSINYEY